MEGLWATPLRVTGLTSKQWWKLKYRVGDSPDRPLWSEQKVSFDSESFPFTERDKAPPKVGVGVGSGTGGDALRHPVGPDNRESAPVPLRDGDVGWRGRS